MYAITVNVKTVEEFERLAALLSGKAKAEAPVEKKLEDFPLQDIMDYVAKVAPKEEPKPLHELMAEDEAKAAKPPKAVKKVRVAEPEPVSDAAPVDKKDTALKLIMQHYPTPAGKKIATDLLKHFAIKNFHLVPDDKVDEFYDMTMAAMKEAGL
jgi:hypothetical protein